MNANVNRQPRQRAVMDSVDSATLKHAAFRGQTEPDSDGDTPLMLAAAQGHAGVVAVLLRNGADVDAHNDRGETALHQAAYGGGAAGAGSLLGAGAFVGARGNSA